MNTKDFQTLLSNLDKLTDGELVKLKSHILSLEHQRKSSPAAPASSSQAQPNDIITNKEGEEGEIVKIYTDGACSGNPGPGGWGATLIFAGNRKDMKGGESNTTNNRMELLAAIEALEALKKPCSVELWTDSTYLRKGITEWIHGWKRNGWKTAAKKPVKNDDLWKRLDAIQSRHKIEWHWVKGHAGHPENERADELARAGMEPYK